MDLIYWALLGLGAFIAIWFLFVAPAERRHHERKLEMLQKRIDARQAARNENKGDDSAEQDTELEEP